MDDRETILGFIPQHETPYNKLLPYSEKLDNESISHLCEIKANLGRTVQLRDIKVGASHWTGQLSKYIRLYGHKYSKEDHLNFIHLLFELTTMPGLEYSLVIKFAQLLHSLIKKKNLLSREDLVIPWRPLYKLLEGVEYNPYDHHGLQLIPANMENVLKNLVKACRLYFSADCTQEILDECRPLMCPFDVTMMKGIYFLELFLPTNLPERHHHQGFRLWLDELLSLWETCQINPSWEGCLISLFARVAHDNIGYIDWENFIPKFFTRVLRSFNLPVGTNKVHVSRNSNHSYDLPTVAYFMSSLLGGGSSCQEHLDKLFKALESFYHPSNFGKWNNKLMKLLVRLPQYVVKRIHRERYKESWELKPKESHRLTDAEVTKFVESIKPVVFLAMFSKFGSHESAMALDKLAVLRPELVIPTLLEKTYPAMETLTEPHRLISCLNCTVAVARAMLGSHKWYPEGRSHVMPLLNLSLPGIDSNDIKKCLTTFQLISTLASLVPLVDCSPELTSRSDLTEEERELCSASAQMEDFVLQFLDRLFSLIENSTQDHMRADSQASDRLTPEETMMEVGMLSTFNAIMQQSSPQIYDEALRKLFRFVSTSVYEIRVAGRYASDLCRAAAKAHPEKALALFITHFLGVIKNRTENEDLSKEEQLDNEFLWNMKLLSETVRCDGKSLLPYKDDLVAVLKATLHLKCKEGADLAGNLLRHILKALSLIYTMDYRSSPESWDKPLDQHLPIRDWGKPGDLWNLNLKWHIPTPEEKAFATELLQEFLVPQLDRLNQHITSNDMTREDVLQSLGVIVHCLIGAGNALPAWSGEPVKIIDCLVSLKRFDNSASTDPDGISIKGQNVRKLVSDTMRPLLDHMLASSEDDTKSLLQLIKVYQFVLFFHGTQKEDFDSRWKSLHVVKRSMENKFLGKKKHIRAVLVDRVQLQHELRVINRAAKIFSTAHEQMFSDLFRLSVSRYSEVRKTAQHVLSHGHHLYAYSYRAILDKVVGYLADDPAIEHHQFKGALYVVAGHSRRSLMTKRSWDIMIKVWPAVVQAQHSEKPSILRLFDDMADKLHKNIESTELAINVTSDVIDAASELFKTSSAPAIFPSASAEDMEMGRQEEDGRNQEALKAYNALLLTLVNLVDAGKLRWKFQQLALEMVSLLGRHDSKYPPEAVRMFVKNMVHDSLQVRKISLSTVSGIFKQQKRKHKMVPIDPFKQAQVEPPTDWNEVHPGDRPDNRWHHYNSQHKLDTKEKWENAHFIEKTHWGYYCWPKEMKMYAPVAEQPKLGRSLDELTAEERPIYEHMNDPQFVEKLIGFLSLEENKGKDKFHSRHFTFFKGLFRNFDDAFLPLLKPHLERLVSDTKHDTHECNQRCGAEIIAGLIRGCKHWSYEKMEDLWSWLLPMVRTALSSMTVESVADWGTCFATAAESRDPRKLAPLLEVLMEEPLRGDGGSFGDSSRLYVLQGALAQQEWRVPELLHRLYAYLKPHIGHTYKNVRDRLGSVFVNMFLYDFPLPYGGATDSPHRADFAQLVLPQLEMLQDPAALHDNHVNNTNKEVAMDTSDSTSQKEVKVRNASVSDVEMVVIDHPSADSETATECVEISMPTDMETSVDDAKKSVNVIGGLLGKKLLLQNQDKDEKNGESEEKKLAIRTCKTVMKWLQGSMSRMLHSSTKEVFQFLPILCVIESECKDDDLRHDAMVTIACIAQALLSSDIIPDVLDVVKVATSSSSWHARAAILGYTQVLVFCNLFAMQKPHLVEHIEQMVLHLMCDEQVEVREMAAVTLGGLLHCGYLTVNDKLMTHFQSLCSTKIKRKKRLEAVKPELMIKRHAGVLGLSACIQAFPYDVPEFIPQILMDLSDHLDDPQPIQLTVKKTLSNFRRTHYDNWLDHKQKFTDDQLVVLTDLLVSPSYYA